MKKIIIVAMAIFGFATSTSAQTFDVGTQTITATLGFGIDSVIPVAISYEYGVVNFGGDHKLGVGGYAGFLKSAFYPAAECNYHFVGVDNLDLYGGARLGFAMLTNGDGGSSFYKSFDIGANYYFSSNWGINAEFGTGMEALNLGVVYKF
ncbi:MAG: hypothetical protein R3Y44_02765 [Rikenellaceae bacterium]